MSDTAIFFDPGRRRWWWIKRLGTLLGLFAVVAVSVWLVSLFTVPLLPGIRGITLEMKRTVRHSIHFPRHQTQLQQFLAKRERQKLLAEYSRKQKIQQALV